MILPTMTDMEVHLNILSDFQLIYTRYFDRLGKKYDRIRRKNHIPKDSKFSWCTEFRTPSKNNWIVVMHKAGADEKYKGIQSIEFCSLVYYYTQKGIRVFKVSFPSGVAVFNAHFFSRYNERMNLNLTDPLAKVKHYFMNNGSAIVKVRENDDRFNLVGKCRDGFLLGEMQNEQNWLVYKTFIPNNMAVEKQKGLSNEMLNSLQLQIEEELMCDDFNRDYYNLLCDVYKSISPDNRI